MIPRKIFFIWVGDVMPNSLLDIYQKNREMLIENGYEVELLTNAYLYKHIADAPEWVKDALGDKQWALVSDWLRNIALIQNGGWYFDIDTVILKPPTELEKYSFVISKDYDGFIANGTIGAEKYSKVIATILRETNDIPSATQRVKDGLIQHFTFTQGDIIKRLAKYDEGIYMAPREYFHPKKTLGKEDVTSEKTISYPLEMYSWGGWVYRLLGKYKLFAISNIIRRYFNTHGHPLYPILIDFDGIFVEDLPTKTYWTDKEFQEDLVRTAHKPLSNELVDEMCISKWYICTGRTKELYDITMDQLAIHWVHLPAEAKANYCGALYNTYGKEDPADIPYFKAHTAQEVGAKCFYESSKTQTDIINLYVKCYHYEG